MLSGFCALYFAESKSSDSLFRVFFRPNSQSKAKVCSSIYMRSTSGGGSDLFLFYISPLMLHKSNLIPTSKCRSLAQAVGLFCLVAIPPPTVLSADIKANFRYKGKGWLSLRRLLLGLRILE